MGRGNIYYITKNKNKDVSFDERTYYDKLDILGVDYVQNQTKEESEIPLEHMQKVMQMLGAVTGYGHDNRDFAFSFWFDDVEKAKQDYFRPKLNNLKQQVEALTLSDVIHSAPYLDFIMDNDQGDLVVFDDEDYECNVSLDNFIRKLEPHVNYYVYKKVILMH